MPTCPCSRSTEAQLNAFKKKYVEFQSATWIPICMDVTKKYSRMEIDSDYRNGLPTCPNIVT